MYYSRYNKEITYTNHYDGLLEVEGKGALCPEDAEVWPDGKADWADTYHTLSVKEGITELKDGYLEAFPKIRCLILSRTVGLVATTRFLDRKLQERDVLIRGEYDTYAEEFAGQKGLRFLPADIPLAEDRIEKHHELDVITLRFHPDADPDIHYNIFLPGSSAGSYGGGEYAKNLPRDFYVGCTMEKFVKNFPDRLADQLMANDRLRRFLEAANRRYGQE